MTDFGEDFMWGAATAGHQIEGNNVLNDIWAMEYVECAPFADRSGDACDSYHRYEEDIALIAESGLDSYRFSIEWSRIEPEAGCFSRAELDHYKRVVGACVKHGVTPIVTLNHFTVPRWFARDGAWNQAEAPDLFERYCQRVVRHLCGEVKWWITLNEPNAGAMLAATGALPLGALDESTDFGKFRAKLANSFARAVGGNPGTSTMALPILSEEGISNLQQAHRQARSAIKKIDPAAKVGWSPTASDHQALKGGESEVARVMKSVIEPFWELSRDDDFVGVQCYTRHLYDENGRVEVPVSDKTFQTGWEYYPEALGHTIRKASEATGVPVLITENGIATSDDDLRIEYTREALQGVADAIRDGVEVLGYLHWSLLDNWEWNSGFAMTFGLVAVDLETFERTPKPSLEWLGMVAKSRGNRLTDDVSTSSTTSS